MKEIVIKIIFDEGSYKGHGDDTSKLILNGIEQYLEYDLESDNVIKDNWKVKILEINDI